MSDTEAYSETISFRVSPSTKRKIQDAAMQGEESVGEFLRSLLRSYFLDCRFNEVYPHGLPNETPTWLIAW